MGQFSKTDFRNNLLTAIYKILLFRGLPLSDNIKLSIVTNPEPNKKHTATDDIARLVTLSEDNIQNRYFDVDAVITLLVFPNQKYPSKFPMWINVSYEGMIDNNYHFILEVSIRYRSPSLMHNKETGHPPFNAILQKV